MYLLHIALDCAGKRLRAKTTDDTQLLLKRFGDECDIFSRLRHPHIVQFLGTYREHGSDIPIMVMEYLPFTLSTLIDEHHTTTTTILGLPEPIAYSILCDVSLALCYFHGYRPDPIIHRDLSANNVLLTRDMTAKISDLGVAKILDISPREKTELQKLTKCPGTHIYMPPEAFTGSYGTPLDIYSFGVLILHIFSGEWPCPSVGTKTEAGILVPVSQTARRQRYFNKMGTDHALRMLTEECIHFNPRRRPTANQIHEAVKTYVPAEGIENTMKLMQRISELQSHVSELESAFSGERERVSELESALSGERERVSELESDLSRERDRISELDSDLSRERERVSELELDLSRERECVSKLQSQMVG